VNGPRFASALGPELERYLAFKQRMGIYCDGRVWYLKGFDRYCVEHSLANVDRATVEGWVSSRIACLPSGSRSWMSYIRDFGRWERLNGDEDAYILSDQWRSGLVRPQPYLLTTEEISRFIDSATRLETRTPWKWQAVAFFGFMSTRSGTNPGCCGPPRANNPDRMIFGITMPMPTSNGGGPKASMSMPRCPTCPGTWATARWRARSTTSIHPRIS
jgi:hypothetical protein